MNDKIWHRVHRPTLHSVLSLCSGAVITVLEGRGPTKYTITPETMEVFQSSGVTTAECYCSLQIFKDITYGTTSTIIDQ